VASRNPGVEMSTDPFVIDGGDRSCVRLLLELRGHIAGLAPGAVIHLIASTYLGPVEAATPTYALRVAANPTPTSPDSPWRPR
jgi:tRNA 2-thiouridine synthesizing protein A